MNNISVFKTGKGETQCLNSEARVFSVLWSLNLVFFPQGLGMRSLQPRPCGRPRSANLNSFYSVYDNFLIAPPIPTFIDLYSHSGFSAQAYPSLKPLGAWTRDLVLRVEQFAKWAETAHPPTIFWMSGFTFPTGFLTAVLQTSARANAVSTPLFFKQHSTQSEVSCLSKNWIKTATTADKVSWRRVKDASSCVFSTLLSYVLPPGFVIEELVKVCLFVRCLLIHCPGSSLFRRSTTITSHRHRKMGFGLKDFSWKERAGTKRTHAWSKPRLCNWLAPCPPYISNRAKRKRSLGKVSVCDIFSSIQSFFSQVHTQSTFWLFSASLNGRSGLQFITEFSSKDRVGSVVIVYQPKHCKCQYTAQSNSWK